MPALTFTKSSLHRFIKLYDMSCSVETKIRWIYFPLRGQNLRSNFIWTTKYSLCRAKINWKIEKKKKKGQSFIYRLCINSSIVYMYYINLIRQWIFHSFYNLFFPLDAGQRCLKKYPVLQGDYRNQFSHSPILSLCQSKTDHKTCSKSKI